MEPSWGNSYPKEYDLFLEKFHKGEYYECHDLLEEIWLAEKQNRFLQGLIQLSVALYHYEYGNVKGARGMLKTALHYLEQYRPKHWGLDVEELCQQIRVCIAQLPNRDVLSLEEAKNRPLPHVRLSFDPSGEGMPQGKES
ncbi:conserved hypothetical protein [[Clostridium] ultunense Esp]|uniref:DUF309 domain-containing protein n=1 Tax=Thermicanus aegyptius TaxID=94009 RepID=UPI0002B70F53|nr:DUF309 domain-containing protein [Thermicanus aegyptius]CCQ97906.1 conserved hypothetical protein [[Clostridium] ultunense Esp]